MLVRPTDFLNGFSVFKYGPTLLSFIGRLKGVAKHTHTHTHTHKRVQCVCVWLCCLQHTHTTHTTHTHNTLTNTHSQAEGMLRMIKSEMIRFAVFTYLLFWILKRTFECGFERESFQRTFKKKKKKKNVCVCVCHALAPLGCKSGRLKDLLFESGGVVLQRTWESGLERESFQRTFGLRVLCESRKSRTRRLSQNPNFLPGQLQGGAQCVNNYR
ncbi:hypothetical protein T492DRAFT_377472 [Pavlovales sp. CCMP2436]|nr:hypothetical protein T492DRAFT_377472 [Pavlovales sp. CCMP2436]